MKQTHRNLPLERSVVSGIGKDITEALLGRFLNSPRCPEELCYTPSQCSVVCSEHL